MAQLFVLLELLVAAAKISWKSKRWYQAQKQSMSNLRFLDVYELDQECVPKKFLIECCV